MNTHTEWRTATTNAADRTYYRACTVAAEMITDYGYDEVIIHTNGRTTALATQGAFNRREAHAGQAVARFRDGAWQVKVTRWA